MLTTFQSVVSKALRVSGQGLDAFGRTFEVFPYVEKCEFVKNCVKFSPIMGFVFLSNISCLILRSLCQLAVVHPVQPSTRAVKLGKKVPVIKQAFIASTATVVGKVEIGSSSSVWYGAILKGEEQEPAVILRAAGRIVLTGHVVSSCFVPCIALR